MNRLTKIQSLNKINERELQMGIAGDTNKSWHQVYKDSAWIYIGNLPYELNEGDMLAVFSQYGEIVNVNLVRDWKTGKSKGFGFLCYQDQRSTVLAVDNFNGIKLRGRPIQVDHVEQYKIPKYREDAPEEVRRLWEEGCAPKPITVPKAELEAVARSEKKERKKQLKKYEAVMELDKSGGVSKELKKARKELRREKKELRRMIRKEKRAREGTPEEERGHADDAGRWELKKKKLDEEDMLDDSKFYGRNDHFNFGKKHKGDEKEAPKFNVRPDFDKADWRDIEIFKYTREYERKTKGEKEVHWQEEQHYVPNRLAPRK